MREASQCSVPCGGEGRQKVTARCEDSVSRELVEPGLCHNQDKPPDSWRACGEERCRHSDRSGHGGLAGTGRDCQREIDI